MVKLAVKIDPIAILKKARGNGGFDIVTVAQNAIKGGAKAIVVHWREGRSNIEDRDIYSLKKNIRVPLHIELQPKLPLIKAAAKAAPKWICFLPGSRSEQTRDGGFSLDSENVKKLVPAIEYCKKRKIKVSILLDPKAAVIRQAKGLGIDAVQLFTKPFTKMTHRSKREEAIEILHVASLLVEELGMGLHMGGGLDIANIEKVAQIPRVDYIIVGYSIISRSVTVGVTEAVEEIKEAIQEVCVAL